MSKKILGISLSIVMLLLLSLGTYKAEGDRVVEEENSISTVTIEGIDCNITVEESDNDNFQYNYDTNIFQVSTTKSTLDDVKITIKTKENAEPQFNDRVYIYIPTNKISKLDVISSNAAIGLAKINTELNIQNNEGVVSFYAFQGLTNDINYTSQNGVGTLKIVKEANNYSFNLTNDASVVSIPFSDYKSFSSRYIHKEGEGSVDINIDLQESVFSLLLDV
ncbi:hypothetical protein [Dethiothermospora halolimnae]|uniref:hypothetical protein n=1 Tax=Dethiothermospora halolimnae TaxID=3114390 RepID=UPI003CCBD585